MSSLCISVYMYLNSYISLVLLKNALLKTWNSINYVTLSNGAYVWHWKLPPSAACELRTVLCKLSSLHYTVANWLERAPRNAGSTSSSLLLGMYCVVTLSKSFTSRCSTPSTNNYTKDKIISKYIDESSQISISWYKQQELQINPFQGQEVKVGWLFNDAASEQRWLASPSSFIRALNWHY